MSLSFSILLTNLSSRENLKINVVVLNLRVNRARVITHMMNRIRLSATVATCADDDCGSSGTPKVIY